MECNICQDVICLTHLYFSGLYNSDTVHLYFSGLYNSGVKLTTYPTSCWC
jgi:hypothetical protein